MVSSVAVKGVFFGLVIAICPLMAQDDATTQHAASGYDGGYITGPASNPLSFLNGPAYRTFGQTNAKGRPLHYDRYRLGLFAASAVVPLVEGLSHHQEGNNIYGAYGGIDRILPNAVLEPFVLWRVQPSVAIETTAKVKLGRQDEKAYGLRFK